MGELYRIFPYISWCYQEFLTHLAINENVAVSTQNQALHAVLFLYKEVLKQDLDLKVDAVRAKKPKYLPTV
ncbi:phage integrase N-terminal SAM-like domain-containing protein [Fischerella thermalis]|uniref:phage integrase N-terminal SAM-like domain-containing protein n=1 Tax=Fischerella thermalis TaxID=372787 RepID=UPI001CA598E9|nr:phage integrase N-terminal SAM-like domain-containing protein [Fischerella thermalis]